MTIIRKGLVVESRWEQNVMTLKDEARAARGKVANLICNGWLMELTCSADDLYHLQVKWYRSKSHKYPHIVDASDMLNLSAMTAVMGAPHRSHLVAQDDQGCWEWREISVAQ